MKEDILDEQLKRCYDKHKVKISEKYYPYLLGAMDSFGSKAWKYGFLVGIGLTLIIFWVIEFVR